MPPHTSTAVRELNAPTAHQPQRNFRRTDSAPRSYLTGSLNAPFSIRVATSRAGGSPWAPSAPPWASSAPPSPCPAAPPQTHVLTSVTATAA